MYNFYVFFKTINWNPTIKCLSEKRVFKLQNMVFPFAPSSVLTKLHAALCEVNHIWKKTELCIYTVPKAEEMFSLVIFCVM